MRRELVATAAIAAALALPAAASAHAGTTAPVATNFDARIVGFQPPAGADESVRELMLNLGSVKNKLSNKE